MAINIGCLGCPGKILLIKKPCLLVVSVLIILFMAHVGAGFVDDDIHEYVCQEHLRQIWCGTWPDQNYSNMTACSLYPQHGFPKDFWITNVESNPGKHYCSTYSCPAKDWGHHWSKVSVRWADEYINGSYKNNEYLYRAMCSQCIADHYISDLQEDMSKEEVLQKILDYNFNQNGSTPSIRTWNPTGRTSAQLREVALNIRKCEERMTARCDDEIQYIIENNLCGENTGSGPPSPYNTSGCPPCQCPEFNLDAMCPPCQPQVVEKIVTVNQPYQIHCPKPPSCPECDDWITSFLLGIPFGAGGMATLVGMVLAARFMLRNRNE